MSARLVGGRFAGKRVSDGGQPRTICVRSTDYADSDAAAGYGDGLDERDAAVTVEQEMYTRRRVTAGGGTLVYFAPEGMSDYDALMTVLG